LSLTAASIIAAKSRSLSRATKASSVTESDFQRPPTRGQIQDPLGVLALVQALDIPQSMAGPDPIKQKAQQKAVETLQALMQAQRGNRQMIEGIKYIRSDSTNHDLDDEDKDGGEGAVKAKPAGSGSISTFQKALVRGLESGTEKAKAVCASMIRGALRDANERDELLNMMWRRNQRTKHMECLHSLQVMLRSTTQSVQEDASRLLQAMCRDPLSIVTMGKRPKMQADLLQTLFGGSDKAQESAVWIMWRTTQDGNCAKALCNVQDALEKLCASLSPSMKSSFVDSSNKKARRGAGSPESSTSRVGSVAKSPKIMPIGAGGGAHAQGAVPSFESIKFSRAHSVAVTQNTSSDPDYSMERLERRGSVQPARSPRELDQARIGSFQTGSMKLPLQSQGPRAGVGAGAASGAPAKVPDTRIFSSMSSLPLGSPTRSWVSDAGSRAGSQAGSRAGSATRGRSGAPPRTASSEGSPESSIVWGGRQENILATVANLASNEELLEKIGRNETVVRVTIEALMFGSERARENATLVLANLACSDENCKSFESMSIPIEEMVGAMLVGSDRAREYVCLALSNLSRRGKIADRILEVEGSKAVLIAVRGSAKSKRARLAAERTLANLGRVRMYKLKWKKPPVQVQGAVAPDAALAVSTREMFKRARAEGEVVSSIVDTSQLSPARPLLRSQTMSELETSQSPMAWNMQRSQVAVNFPSIVRGQNNRTVKAFYATAPLPFTEREGGHPLGFNATNTIANVRTARDTFTPGEGKRRGDSRSGILVGSRQQSPLRSARVARTASGKSAKSSKSKPRSPE
jgi:hypothetical protein